MEDDLFLHLNEIDDQPFDGLGDDYPIPDLSTLPEDVEGLDETKIEQLLQAVRAQYAQLEEENSRLIQLSNLIKEKIENCINREIAAKVGASPSIFPLDLNVKTETQEEDEFEEDSD